MSFRSGDGYSRMLSTLTFHARRLKGRLIGHFDLIPTDQPEPRLSVRSGDLRRGDLQRARCAGRRRMNRDIADLRQLSCAAAVGVANVPLDTFPKLLLAHARLRPGRVAMREKDYGIWQSWCWA